MALSATMQAQGSSHDYRQHSSSYVWHDSPMSSAPSSAVYGSASHSLYSTPSSLSPPESTFATLLSPTQSAQSRTHEAQFSDSRLHGRTTQPTYSSLQHALHPSISQSPFFSSSIPTIGSGSSSRPVVTPGQASVASGPSNLFSSSQDRVSRSWTDGLLTLDDNLSPAAGIFPDSLHNPSSSIHSNALHRAHPGPVMYTSMKELRNPVKDDPEESDVNARYILEQHPLLQLRASPESSEGSSPLSPIVSLSPEKKFSFSSADGESLDFFANVEEPSLPHEMTAPLRAVNASKEMRRMMGVFRLNPFTMLNGMPVKGAWDGSEAGPLEEEPVQFEFQLDIEGLEIDDEETEGQDTRSNEGAACPSDLDRHALPVLQMPSAPQEVDETKFTPSSLTTAPNSFRGSIFDRDLERQRERISGRSLSATSEGFSEGSTLSNNDAGLFSGESVSAETRSPPYVSRPSPIYPSSSTSMYSAHQQLRSQAALRARPSHPIYRGTTSGSNYSGSLFPTPASLVADMHMADRSSQIQGRTRHGSLSSGSFSGSVSPVLSGTTQVASVMPFTPLQDQAHGSTTHSADVRQPTYADVYSSHNSSAYSTSSAHVGSAGSPLSLDSASYPLSEASFSGGFNTHNHVHLDQRHSSSRRWSDAASFSRTHQ